MQKTTKKAKTVLINISNNSSNKWDIEQREGIDKIIDIHFPIMPPEYSGYDIVSIVDNIVNKVKEILDKEAKKKNEIYITLEYTNEYSIFYDGLYTRIANIIENKYKDYEYGIKYARPVIKKIFDGWLIHKF